MQAKDLPSAGFPRKRPTAFVAPSVAARCGDTPSLAPRHSAFSLETSLMPIRQPAPRVRVPMKLWGLEARGRLRLRVRLRVPVRLRARARVRAGSRVRMRGQIAGASSFGNSLWERTVPKRSTPSSYAARRRRRPAVALFSQPFLPNSPSLTLPLIAPLTTFPAQDHD